MTYIFIGIFIFFVAMDQLSKSLAVEMLGEVGSTIEFIPKLIRFEYCRNTGMAWGLLKNARFYFIAVTILLTAFLLYFMIRRHRTIPKLVQLSLTLILSGAIGNLIDRLFLGYVRDFIAFDFIDFPVFNIADACVTTGAILLIISLLLTRQGRDFIKLLEEEDAERSLKRKMRRENGTDQNVK